MASQSSPMKILITMAGDGARFKVAGFDAPKPCINVRGRTLFEWSLLSLVNFFELHFVFISRKEHLLGPFIAESCSRLGIAQHSIVELSERTRGQAETAVLGGQAMGISDEAIAIYNIDTFVDGACFSPVDIKGDGWIPIFEAEGPQWSFLIADSELRVSAIAEKKRISNTATLGFYYFSSLNLLADLYRRSNFDKMTERYVAPLYEKLIADPARIVYAYPVPSSMVHVLGTPDEVSAFAETASQVTF